VPRFLFWNLQGRDLRSLVVDLAAEHKVDIIILAECQVPEGAMLERLNSERPQYELAPTRVCKSITFFSSFSASFFTPVVENARVSIRRLTLPARKEILVAAAHLPSRMHFSEGSSVFECSVFAEMIRRQERELGHSRTVVLGDLNANPFEIGIVGTGGLHAVMSRYVASRRTRTVQAHDYDFFYNPMWSHFGDRPEGPPGTFYYEKAEHVVYFWNMFDQVLIRPDLLDGFDSSDLRILTTVAGTSLVRTDGRPDTSTASDHLPILLDLEF
jgi:hypothetical protein